MRGTNADGPEVVVARVAKGLTQEQLADSAGLDVKTVRKAEQGGRVDLASLSRLAAVLDVSLDRLVSGGSETPTDRARRESVQRWHRAWDAHDVDAILALYHDEAVLHLPGEPDIPFAGVHRGKEAIRRCHETAWANFRTEPVPPGDFSVLVCEDTVVLWGSKGVSGPDGTVVKLSSIQVFTFEGDRIIEHRVEFDTLRFSRVTTPPDSPPAA
jgi:transcriptional regulator with XRE-family HTH domain